MKMLDLAGQKFGRLTAIEPVGVRHHQKLWKCMCDCGKEHYVEATKLKNGKIKSCGCLVSDTSKEVAKRIGLSKSGYKHGDYGTKLYGIWAGMKRRCYNEKQSGFKWYGAKGIKVCDEWLDYEGFKKWALENGYSEGFSIERIDNNKNYEPSNCKWIPKNQQGYNTNKVIQVEYEGKTYTVREIAEMTGLKKRTIRGRIERNCSPEEIFSPVLKKNQY